MPDRTFTIPALGEPQQLTVAASSSGSATAGAVVLVVPDGMSNEAIRRGLSLLEDLARRVPQQITGV